MKHAHIITHSSTHAVCLLLFLPENEEQGPALPADSPWQKEQRNLLSAAIVMGLYLPGRLYLLLSSLSASQIQLSPVCCYSSTLPLLRACVSVALCVRYSHILIFISQDRTHIHKLQAEPKTSNSFISSSVFAAIACSCAILSRRKKTSAILAQQAVDDWSCDLGI